MREKSIVSFIFLLLASIMLTATAFAGPKLIWDPPASGEVTGYRLYYGTASGNYGNNIEIGVVTEYALSNLSLADKTTYFFSLRAFNGSGEGPGSNEVSWASGDNTPPLPPLGVTVK